jgi:hypothetical protein
MGGAETIHRRTRPIFFTRPWPLACARVLVVVVLFLCVSPARADEELMKCVDANAESQVARKSGRFRDARRQLISCSRPTCPSAVRADCAQMLKDLAEAQPTVVIEARDPKGAETTQVRVSFDGEVVADTLTGLELELDPGSHRLRFELRSGESIEQEVVLLSGEKRRRLAVRFEGKRPSTTAREPAPPVAARPAPAPSPSTSPSPLPYVLGAIAVVGAVGFVYFGVTGKSEEKDLASSCAPFCDSGQVDAVRGRYVAADVSLGISVVSLGAAIALLWLNHRGSSANAGSRRFDAVAGADAWGARRW